MHICLHNTIYVFAFSEVDMKLADLLDSNFGDQYKNQLNETKVELTTTFNFT